MKGHVRVFIQRAIPSWSAARALLVLIGVCFAGTAGLEWSSILVAGLLLSALTIDDWTELFRRAQGIDRDRKKRGAALWARSVLIVTTAKLLQDVSFCGLAYGIGLLGRYLFFA